MLKKTFTQEGIDNIVKGRLAKERKNWEKELTDTNYPEWLKNQQEKHGKGTVENLKKKTVNVPSDKEQFERYKDILGDEFIPDSLDKFQEMKYNDVDKWNDIKKKYRIVNQYQNHTDFKMPVSKILELDEKAFSTKRNDFTSKLKKRGNFGIMDFDGRLFYAHSQVSNIYDETYTSFKGDKTKLILKPYKQTFKTLYINTHDRNVDSEYK